MKLISKRALIGLCLLFFSCQFAYAETWQESLKGHFDIVDTFDHYQDWHGQGPNNGCTEGFAPIEEGAGLDIFRKHCYWDRTASVESRPNAIDSFSSNYIVSGKGMRINWLGNGDGNQEIGGVKAYIGDGSWTSGYDEIYIFFSMYMPEDRLITRTKEGSNSRYIGSIKEGEETLFMTSGKWVCVSVGFADVEDWGPSGVDEHDCRWGWSEIHFHIKNKGTPRMPVVALDSGGTYFSTAKGDVDITQYLGKKIWVELYLKRESSIGVANGAAKCTFYDSNGRGTAVLDVPAISLLDPDSACKNKTGVSISQGDQMRFNRINFESNWRVKNPGDQYICCGKLYDSSGKEIRDLACQWYMDDLIIDDKSIAESYFSLLNGEITNPTRPSAPNNLVIREQ